MYLINLDSTPKETFGRHSPHNAYQRRTRDSARIISDPSSSEDEDEIVNIEKRYKIIIQMGNRKHKFTDEYNFPIEQRVFTYEGFDLEAYPVSSGFIHEPVVVHPNIYHGATG